MISKNVNCNCTKVEAFSCKKNIISVINIRKLICQRESIYINILIFPVI